MPSGGNRSTNQKLAEICQYLLTDPFSGPLRTRLSDSNYPDTLTLRLHAGFWLAPLVSFQSYLMDSIWLSAVLSPEDSGSYVALCPELDIASQGESINEAMRNLKEAVEGFFEVASPKEVQTRLKRPALFTHFEVTRA